MAAVSFKLTCTLAAPVSLNHPWIHLDGIINHLRMMRRLGRDYYSLSTKGYWQPSVAQHDKFQQVLAYRQELPFASISHFEPADAPLKTVQYFKRFEANDFPTKRKKIDIASGHYRNWMMRTVYVPAHTVSFYGRGQIGRVRQLLGDLTHVGNDTRVGWGQLVGWELEELEREQDRSIVWEGIAQRPIPVRMLKHYTDSVRLAWKAPYWERSNIEECAPPGTEVELA